MKEIMKMNLFLCY